MCESSTLDVIRYDADGKRISWSSVQMGFSTQYAPFQIHGHFGEGEEIWFSKLVYADGIVLIDAHAAPRYEEGVEQGRARKVFLIYPGKDAAAAAGWRM